MNLIEPSFDPTLLTSRFQVRLDGILLMVGVAVRMMQRASTAVVFLHSMEVISISPRAGRRLPIGRKAPRRCS
jgi:hypothetical protein